MVAEHQGFCLKIVESVTPTPTTEIHGTKNFDFGSALGNAYPLLDVVFSYLGYDELKTCLQVHRTWKEMAKKNLEKRVEPSWFTCFRKVTKLKCPYSLGNSCNLKYNSISIGIILVDIRKIRSYKKMCVHKGQNSFSITSIGEYIDGVLVPKDTQYCLISCCRVLSSFQPEMNLADQYAIDGLLLPEIPNIKTTMFYYPGNNNPYLNNQQNGELKCLLIFIPSRISNKNLKKNIKNLLSMLIHKNNKSVALGGGVIRGISSPQTFGKKNTSDVLSIAFWQGNNSEADFDAFSCVISGDYLTKVQFTSEVLKFKERTILRRYSVAIRICCSAKKNAEEEIVVFGEIFRKVPLLGLYADGELGWNSSSLTSNVTQNGDPQNIHHQWSTVFVVMTWD